MTMGNRRPGAAELTKDWAVGMDAVRVATAGLVLDDSGVDNTRTDVLCVDELSSGQCGILL